VANRCDRLAELDVLAYLADPLADRWGALREHVISCADCRSRIEALQRLQESFAQPIEEHPAEELLLRYADDPASLETSKAADLAEHLRTCPSCRDELAVLEGTTAASVREPTVASEPLRPAAWRRLLRTLGEPGWRPVRAAAVFAVLVAVTLPVLRARHFREPLTLPTPAPMTPSEASLEDRAEIIERDVGSLRALAAKRTGRAERSSPSTPAEPAAPSTTAAPPPAAAGASSAAASPAVPADESATTLFLDAAPANPTPRGPGLSALSALQRAPAAEPAPRRVSLAYRPSRKVIITSAVVPSLDLAIVLRRGPATQATDSTAGRGSTDAALANAGRAMSLSAPAYVNVPQPEERVVLRITRADGKTYDRPIVVSAATLPQDGTITEKVWVDADWLTTGENRLDVLDERGESLAPPFVVELR